jgi:hypothetical protein
MTTPRRTHDDREELDHGLGHLLPPCGPDIDDTDWIKEAWAWLIAADLGLDAPKLPWLHLPAVSRISVSTPGEMRHVASYRTSSDAIGPPSRSTTRLEP